MDTTETITHLGLCAGYGGIELGLKRVLPTMRTIALCEIEAFAIANLVAKMEAGLMDPAPIWTNLKTFPWAEFSGKVDILTGGFPCQPFSAAGKRAGDQDERHLFPYILDGIRILRPSIVFLENVEGIISAKLRGDEWEDPAGTSVLLHVLRQLERVGYKATAGIFSASEVGAPHQRKRVFILAYRNSERGQLSDWWEQSAEQVSVGNGEAWRDVWPTRPGEHQHAWEPPRVVGNAKDTNDSIRQTSWTDNANRPFGQNDNFVGQIKHRRASGNYRGNAGQTQSPLGGDTDGPASGLDYAELCESCDNSAGVSKYNSNGGRTIMANTANDGCASSSTSTRVCGAEPDTRGEEESQGVIQFKGSGTFSSLCISCDNRTDELRLLGNGVVPATAEKAFRTLWNQL